MPRIGQARAQHTLIAGDDRRTEIIRRQIRHEGEIGRRASGLVAQGKIFLVDLHRQLADFRRQVHEIVVDAADQRHRPFHQPGDLVEQPVIRGDGEIPRRRLSGDAFGDFVRRSAASAIT